MLFVFGMKNVQQSCLLHGLTQMSRLTRKLEKRKGKLLLNNLTATQIDLMSYFYGSEKRFVAFPQSTVGGSSEMTPMKPMKEDTMNEFYSERSALEIAARKVYREHSEENKKKFHLTSEQPTTTREAFEWYSKGYFKKLEDKELDRKLHAYESPFEKIEFRKHEPDLDGYTKADAQDMASFEQDLMYIRALPPSEALTKTRTIH